MKAEAVSLKGETGRSLLTPNKDSLEKDHPHFDMGEPNLEDTVLSDGQTLWDSTHLKSQKSQALKAENTAVVASCVLPQVHRGNQLGPEV